MRDQAEESLLQEVATLQQCKEKLNFLHQKVIDQVKRISMIRNSYCYSNITLVWITAVIQLRPVYYQIRFKIRNTM